MTEPGAEPVPGIVAHRLHLGRGAKRVAHPFRGPLVVGREADADVAIVEDRIVRAVSLLDLIEGLRDQEALQAVARHEGQRALEEVEPPQGGKLVQHHQHAVTPVFGVQVFGQAAPDLVEHQADQRLRAGDVGWRHHEIEGRWPGVGDQVRDPPVATPCHLRDDGIAIEAEKGHRGGQDAGEFVLALVEQLARRRGDDGMRTGFAEMRRRHHRLQRRLDLPARVG